MTMNRNIAAENTIMREIVTAIKRGLKHRNMTQTELARVLGIPRQQLSQIMLRENAGVNVHTVVSIFSALGLRVRFRVEDWKT